MKTTPGIFIRCSAGGESSLSAIKLTGTKFNGAKASLLTTNFCVGSVFSVL